MLALSPTSLTYSNPISANPVTSYSVFSNPLTMASFYYPENPVLTVVNRIADGTVTSGWGKGQACSGLMAAIDRFFGWGICPQQTAEDASSLQKRQIYQVTNFTYEMTNSARCDLVEKPPVGTNYSYAVEIAAIKKVSNNFFHIVRNLPPGTCSFYSSSLSLFYDSQKTPSPYIFEPNRRQVLSTCIQNYLDQDEYETNDSDFNECEAFPDPQKLEINQTYVKCEVDSVAYKDLTYLFNITSNQITNGTPTNINIHRTEMIIGVFLDHIFKCEQFEKKLYAKQETEKQKEKERTYYIIGGVGLGGISLILVGWHVSICRSANKKPADTLPQITDETVVELDEVTTE